MPHTGVTHNASPIAHRLRVALLTLPACVAGVGAAVGTAAAENGADDTTPAPSTTPRAPLISEIEADAKATRTIGKR